MSSHGEAHPRVSVIVRSYNRLPALLELLRALFAQDHDSFEIVVVEQSTERAPGDLAALEALAPDPRLRVLRFPPLGGPRARNTGVRAARGGLFVFIDDDDLPIGSDWLRRHEANFHDPKCLGATGQFVEPDAAPYVNFERARKNVLSFSWLRWQRVYARTDRRKHVDSVMGGNVAIPRRTLERFGLWDECTPIEDEPSLAYRINASKTADEYLVFDPEVKMLRRLDMPGGMAKRMLSGPRYGQRVFTFLHNIIAHYFPLRFVVLYPAYLALTAYHVTQWIWCDSLKHRTLGQRISALLGFYLAFIPLWMWWLASWCFRRIAHGPPSHRPPLDPIAMPAPSAAVPPDDYGTSSSSDLGGDPAAQRTVAAVTD